MESCGITLLSGHSLKLFTGTCSFFGWGLVMGGTGWRRKVKKPSQTQTLGFDVKYLMQASKVRTASMSAYNQSFV